MDKIAGEVKHMYLPVILASIALLSMLLLFLSIRISIEFIARETGITYTIKGSVFRYVKVLEVKSGTEKRWKKRRKAGSKERRLVRDRLPGLIQTALKRRKGRMFHIEELSLNGTFSIKDAAANAVIYGVLLILWQFLLIFLAANFKLERHNYNFMPDFKNNKNEMMLHIIFRFIPLKIILLIIHWIADTNGKKFNKSE